MSNLNENSITEMRVGFIGGGIAGQSHLFDAITNPQIEIAAICTRQIENAKSVADSFGISGVYEDARKMIEQENLQALVIATPHNKLAHFTKMALEFDLFVLTEKPLAALDEEVDQLQQYKTSALSKVAVPYNRRYSKAWAAARNWYQMGKVGEVSKFMFDWSGPYAHFYGPNDKTFRSKPDERVNGVLLDCGSHILDTLLWFTDDFGKIESIEILKNEDVDIGVRAQLKQAEGFEVMLSMEPVDSDISVDDKACHKETKRLTIIGDKGKITVDNEEGAKIETLAFSDTQQDAYNSRPIDDLIQMQNDEDVCGATAEEAMRTINFINKMYRGSQISKGQNWKRPRFKPMSRLNGAC